MAHWVYCEGINLTTHRTMSGRSTTELHLAPCNKGKHFLKQNPHIFMHIIKYHSDSKRGNLLPPLQGLLYQQGILNTYIYSPISIYFFPFPGIFTIFSLTFSYQNHFLITQFKQRLFLCFFLLSFFFLPLLLNTHHAFPKN